MRKEAVYGLLILFTAFGLYAAYQIATLKNYCYNLVGWRVSKITANSVEIVFNFRIKNKSNIDVTLNGYKFDVFMNNVLVAKVKSLQKTEIRGKSSRIIQVPVQFIPTKEILTNVRIDFIKRQLSDSNIIRFLGTVSLSNYKIIQLKNYPIDIVMPLKEMVPVKDDVC